MTELRKTELALAAVNNAIGALNTEKAVLISELEKLRDDTKPAGTWAISTWSDEPSDSLKQAFETFKAECEAASKSDHAKPIIDNVRGKRGRKPGFKMDPATIAKIVATRRARAKGKHPTATPARKHKISPEGLARIAEAARKRWAEARAAKAAAKKGGAK